MARRSYKQSCLRISKWLMVGLLAVLCAAGAAVAQDPVPQAAPPRLNLLPPPAGAITLGAVSESDLRATIKGLVSCGTRHSLSSWTDPARGIGCGRDHIVAEFKKIAAGSGGRLHVVVDRFEVKAPRTGNKLVPMENVLAILPGDDPALAKTVFVVSGHFDSMPTNIMDPKSDAPGADDDGSGTAVSIECARLLARGHYRSTLVFATVSGEEQGLLGGTRLLKYLEQEGYTVGGMLDNDIVGADFAPGAPHRVRLFSGDGKVDDGDSPSRELARRIEEIDGRHNIRLVFRLDRLGRGGDHIPFYEA